MVCLWLLEREKECATTIVFIHCGSVLRTLSIIHVYRGWRQIYCFVGGGEGLQRGGAGGVFDAVPLIFLLNDGNSELSSQVASIRGDGRLASHHLSSG